MHATSDHIVDHSKRRADTAITNIDKKLQKYAGRYQEKVNQFISAANNLTAEMYKEKELQNLNDIINTVSWKNS